MNWTQIFLLCFAVGTLWSLLTVVLGGAHFGRFHLPHLHHGHGHVHAGHIGQGHGHHVGTPGWLSSLLTPASLAVFLAWFGGVGYILSRHSGFARWLDICIAALLGSVGAVLLAAFLRWLQSHDQPLEAYDPGLIGVLGRVSAPLAGSSVGELIFVRDESRRALPARSEDGQAIPRGEEVVVTRYENGIAYVRTWEALSQPEAGPNSSGNSARGDSL